MKKITLLLLLVFNYSFSQSGTTGPISLTTGYTVEFAVDSGTNMVTMTMIGPDDRWLGVAPGASAPQMGNGTAGGNDCIVYSNSGLQDRNMPAGNGTPGIDGNQDWMEVSNNTSGGIRTLIATRALNTGDSNDFVFPTDNSAFSLLWAIGNDLNFGYHSGGTRGGAMANLTLGNPNFNDLLKFSILPNPVSTEFKVQLPNTIENASVEVYDVLGKQVYSSQISGFDAIVNVSELNSGMYLVRVTADNISQTKRFIKQ